MTTELWPTEGERDGQEVICCPLCDYAVPDGLGARSKVGRHLDRTHDRTNTSKGQS